MFEQSDRPVAGIVQQYSPKAFSNKYTDCDISSLQFDLDVDRMKFFPTQVFH